MAAHLRASLAASLLAVSARFCSYLRSNAGQLSCTVVMRRHRRSAAFFLSSSPSLSASWSCTGTSASELPTTAATSSFLCLPVRGSRNYSISMMMTNGSNKLMGLRLLSTCLQNVSNKKDSSHCQSPRCKCLQSPPQP